MPAIQMLACHNSLCPMCESDVHEVDSMLVRSTEAVGAIRKSCNGMQDDEIDMDLTPKQVVDRLDRYIVGQVRLVQSLRKACCPSNNILHALYYERNLKEPCIRLVSHQCTGGCKEGCSKCFAQQMATAEAPKPNEGTEPSHIVQTCSTHC